MKLCDDCINILSSELSQRSIDTLNKSLNLFTSGEPITAKEIWQVAKISKYHMEEVLNELEENMFIKSSQAGRRVFYELTENGKRLLELELEDNFIKEDAIDDQIEEVNNKVDSLGEDLDKDHKEDLSNDNIEEVDGEKSEVNSVKEDKAEKKDSKNIVWDLKF
ncbi:hypothetical protein [Orenia marismortui]|uniref:hypothetical protein n=1 Tax=Orenia marismortui TaxID=46469 RepID=UPI000370AC7C|nr:hypothetical protein [Orenia marismortui]